MTPPLEEVYPEVKKICPNCGAHKKLVDFYKNRARRYGRTAYCKKCFNEKSKARYRKTHPYLPKPIIQESKICLCPTCELAGVLQPLANYHKAKHGKYGVHAWCAKCTNAKKKADYPTKYKGKYQKQKEKYPEKLRAKDAYKCFWKFRTNQAWFDEKLDKQNDKCAICGRHKSEQKKRFHIDHFHGCCGRERACDKCRRGLLCTRCNTRLGSVENREWLDRAIAYLNNYTNGDKYDISALN